MAITKEHITFAGLRRRGISIIPGNKYIPKSLLPKKVPSLAHVRQRLSKIKGSLAKTVACLREKE